MGTAMGKLSGYALSIPLLPADHTYVLSDVGDIWPCPAWARWVGGTLLCSGTANLGEARCLSQPKSTAGLIYGITGVCHQMANRILLTAGGAVVSQARGYRGSFFAWGDYGKERGTGKLYCPTNYPWPELTTCRTSHRH